ncbi:hypothetical protein Syun_025017 [Stephania yunnanensis]|uniref:N-acetyltransferase domain-containing protein n=1 Tax=Stephania yunnanensis TaxID=152371 RepID=A0AAP0ETU5_9MAGN
MALLSWSSPSLSHHPSWLHRSNPPNQTLFATNSPNFRPQQRFFSSSSSTDRTPFRLVLTCQLCTQEALAQDLDVSSMRIAEAFREDELWAAAFLRIRSFYEYQQQSYGINDHRNYLAEREFEALKERIAGKRTGFRRVTCINATLPLLRMPSFASDLCSFSQNGEEQVVIGTLDLNQCLKLPDEITGKRPEVGIGSDFLRAYLSNVCVAKELHRNGIAHSLVLKSKEVAEEWGITDLYVHAAVDNEPAKRLYTKSGFTLESDEPAWQARFLDRPRRLLLWADVSKNNDL